MIRKKRRKEKKYDKSKNTEFVKLQSNYGIHYGKRRNADNNIIFNSSK